MRRTSRCSATIFHRNREQHLLQCFLELDVGLRPTADGHLVEQRLLAPLAAPLRHLHNVQPHKGQVGGDPLPGDLLCELGDHEKAQGALGVSALSASQDETTSRGTIEPRHFAHGKVTSKGVVGLATATIDGLTFPFNFLSPT